MSRRPFVAGNWKMHKTAAEAAEFVGRLAAHVPAEVDVGLCPPYTALAEAAAAAAGLRIAIYAQNMHQAPGGAYTGEISAEMILDTGANGVLLGHSERRRLFGETDETVARRTVAALEHGLGVIACVGESGEERQAGQTELILHVQVEAIRDAVGPHERLVIAYEPVWAIGTGQTATPNQAQKAHAFIKSLVDVPVLYGGSVKPENADEILSEPDVDGALVGGASLEVDSFTAICQSAARIRS